MISETVIQEAIAAEACADGLAWAKAGHTYAETLEQQPDWYLWGKGNCPSWEDTSASIAAAARARPGAALEYAVQYLSPESLAAAAKACPWAALEYAAQHLSQESLAAAAKAEPWAALEFAKKHMTPELIAECEKQVAT